MLAEARRLPSRFLRRIIRRAYPMFYVVGALLASGPGWSETILTAKYADPTTRYDHGVLGDAIEWGTLEVSLDGGIVRRFILPENLVFEDTAPRLADLDGDGSPEVIVVESSLSSGARLVIYGPKGRLAQTDHIGLKNRWLAPVGAADFTSDGRLEVAMVVTPHLAGRLELLAFDGSSLTRLGTLEGLTNHRIGDATIAGGIRTCDKGPELLLAQMPWRRTGRTAMVAVRFQNNTLIPESFTEEFSPTNIAKAIACDINPA